MQATVSTGVHDAVALSGPEDTVSRCSFLTSGSYMLPAPSSAMVSEP